MLLKTALSELKKNSVWVIIVLLFSMIAALPARAQTLNTLQSGTYKKKQPLKRIERPMIGLDAATLYTEGTKIHLWGIKPAHLQNVVLELEAMATMDRLIGNKPVSCRIMKWSITEHSARCTAETNEDLGLSMLEMGYAVVDRLQTYNSVFASAYAKAQENARLKEVGIWADFAAKKTQSKMPGWLEDNLLIIMPLSLILSLLMLLMGVPLAVSRGFSKQVRADVTKVSQASDKEDDLLIREKRVVLAALSSELVDNKSTIEAYLIIYNEMLKTLKGPEEPKKYQESGDVFAKHPVLGKGVFAENAQKLSELDVKLASDISCLYALFQDSSEYVTLETSDPLGVAVKNVEEVVANAGDLIPKIDEMIGRLKRISAG